MCDIATGAAELSCLLPLPAFAEASAGLVVRRSLGVGERQKVAEGRIRGRSAFEAVATSFGRERISALFLPGCRGNIPPNTALRPIGVS
jgi:hypothetical protein